MRAAAYHTAAASDRRAAHRALAAHEQPIGAALHLADASLPDRMRALAATLEAAAREARGRSGYAAAAELFERAAIFSVDPGDRARRLLESGRAFEVAGDLCAREACSTEHARAADDPLLRTEIEHVRGRAALWRGELGLARDVLAPEALRVASFSPTSALPILADALAALVLAGEIRAAEALAAEALEQIRGITTELTALSGGVSGQLTVLAGDAERLDAIARLDRLHGDGSAVLEATSAQYAIAFLVQAYAWHEQFDRGRQIAERAIERAHTCRCGGSTSMDPRCARRSRAPRGPLAPRRVPHSTRRSSSAPPPGWRLLSQRPRSRGSMPPRGVPTTCARVLLRRSSSRCRLAHPSLASRVAPRSGRTSSPRSRRKRRCVSSSPSCASSQSVDSVSLRSSRPLRT